MNNKATTTTIMMNNHAFSNPEYMCFSELKTLLDLNMNSNGPHNKAASSVAQMQTLKKHRPVPLPPPPRRPPPPPPIAQVSPPLAPTYQNFAPIHIECGSSMPSNASFISSSSSSSTAANNNLLKIGCELIDETASSYNSMIMLSTSTNIYNSSDSSTATMIVRNSPTPPVTSSSSLKQQHQHSIVKLSPIMTSSRADLKADFMNRIANNRFHEHQDSTILSSNECEPMASYLTQSLPFKRNGHQRQCRLSFDLNDLKLNETNTDITLINHNQHHMAVTSSSCSSNTTPKKWFNNHNYEMHSLSPSLSSSSINSSLTSLILQPPSPFKTSSNSMSNKPVLTPSKSSIKPAHSVDKQAAKQVKKVSFMLKREDLFSLDFDEEHRRNSISSDSSASSSASSSSTSSSSSMVISPRDRIIFANTDYFLNLHQIEPCSSSSSSSSSSSTCSSTSSSSSGYKSNHSTLSTNPKLSPTDLSVFIQSNQERLERLRTKRTELLNLTKNINQLNNDLDLICQERLSEDSDALADLDAEQRQITDCLLLKNASVKVFQTLLNTKQQSQSVNNSPMMTIASKHIHQGNTLPRRSILKQFD